MDVTDLDEHVMFEDGVAGVHFLEDAEAYLEIADIVLFVEEVEPYLKMSTIVLFRLRLISEGYDEIVDDNLLLAARIIH